MTGDIKLTAFNRQGSKSHVSERGEDDFPKPRIKLIHPSGEIRYFFLEDKTEEENPKFSVIIDGVKHYIGKSGWAIDFIFSSAVSNLLKLNCNNHYVDPVTDYDVVGKIVSGTDKWYGGVLAPNRKIYCVPSSSNNVLVVDTNDETTELIGSFGTNTDKWCGGVLAPNGKIYCVPSSSNNVLEIDPETSTCTVLSENNIYGYNGGVLAPNGKIYCVPSVSKTVLIIDTTNLTFETFGNYGVGYDGWCGGVLAPNGKIYCVPNYVKNVLEIDPETKTATTFGTNTGSHRGGVLAPNRKIYCVPRSGQILEIDPETKTLDFFGENMNGNTGCVLSPNGNIYSASYGGGVFQEINPETKTNMAFELHSEVSIAYAFSGNVLSPNGKVYNVPNRANKVFSVYTGENSSNGILSPFFNKF